jgi:Nucleoside 2-deoxyribosyltransferase like
MKKVFLGGTCNGSEWRQGVISNLKIHYYDPMKEHWTPEMMQEEIKQRNESDFCLYVLTPKMDGFFSVAELADDSNKQPGKTIFCFLNEDGGKSFSKAQVKSLRQVAELVKRNGAKYFETLNEVVGFLNNE